MNESEYIYCSRCGAVMKKDARYCMKCGNLNYNHPDNKSMQKYAPLENKTYEIGSGKISANSAFTANTSAYATNTGNKGAFFALNILLFIIIYGGLFLLGFMHIIDFSVVFLMFILLSIFNIYFISLEIINMKANKPWWGALVPIYNTVLLTDIAFEKMIYVIFLFIPIVSSIFMLVLFYQIGKKFNKNAILTMLFSIFMLPIIAFGSSTYKGVNYVDLKDRNAIEKDFKTRKNLLYIILLFFIIGVGGIVYTNVTSDSSILKDADKKIFIENAKVVLNKVEKKIKKGDFTCFEDTNLAVGTTHYFVINNLRDDLNIYSFDDKVVTAVVKVFNNKGNLEYAISMSNGEVGFFELKKEELSIDKIIDYEEIVEVDNEKSCYLD